MGQIFQEDKHLFVLLNTYLAFASDQFARSEFQQGIFMNFQSNFKALMPKRCKSDNNKCHIWNKQVDGTTVLGQSAVIWV